MDDPLNLQFFNFCPMEHRSILGLFCTECMFVAEVEGEHFCTFLQAQANGDFIPVKGLITQLLDVLEDGQTHLTKEEILNLLENKGQNQP